MKEFYQKWQTDGLVVLKWLALIAGSNVPGNVEAVKSLTQHEAFNIKNPNNCYSVFLGFCRSHPNFHAEDGSGYRFLADSIITVSNILRMLVQNSQLVFHPSLALHIHVGADLLRSIHPSLHYLFYIVARLDFCSG